VRIGIEAQRVFREKKHGMDFVVLELILELQKIDLINEYFIFVNSGPDDQIIKETKNFKIIRFNGLYPIWEQVLLPRQCKKYQLDVLHSTSNTAPYYLKTAQVVTIHDIIYMEVGNVLNKGYTPYQLFGNFYRKIIVSRLVKSVKHIITVSNFEKRTIQNFFKDLEPSRLSAVYNGVSTHFKPIEDVILQKSMREKYDLPEQYFLFLGNTDPKKNTANTLVAFAKYCKEYSSKYDLLVGDLDRDEILKHLKEEGLEDQIHRIRNTGYIPNSELPALISMAHIFLYPSKRESFGIPLLEAMACGTPVITGDKSSLPEIAADAALIVNVFDANNITKAIDQLVQDDDLRQSLIQKGLERSTSFSWENTARETLKIYQQLNISNA
jgi:glycosyltransferase involved in cell wall biosynthesis